MQIVPKNPTKCLTFCVYISKIITFIVVGQVSSKIYCLSLKITSNPRTNLKRIKQDYFRKWYSRKARNI